MVHRARDVEGAAASVTRQVRRRKALGQRPASVRGACGLREGPHSDPGPGDRHIEAAMREWNEPEDPRGHLGDTD